MKRWMKTVVAGVLSIIPSATQLPKDAPVEEGGKDTGEITAKDEPLLPQGSDNDAADVTAVPDTAAGIEGQGDNNWWQEFVKQTESGKGSEEINLEHLRLSALDGDQLQALTQNALRDYEKSDFYNEESNDLIVILPKSEEEEVYAVSTRTGEKYLCSFLNTNDDRIAPSEEQFAEDIADGYMDGGWTQGLAIGCETRLDDGAIGFGGIQHNMFTPQMRTDVWEPVDGQRPMGGEFNFFLGRKSEMGLGEQGGLSNYFQGNIAYRETDITQSIQEIAHGIDGSEYLNRNYDDDPLETGLVGEISYGALLDRDVNIGDNIQLSTGVFGGWTEGIDYSGAVSGGRIRIGSSGNDSDAGFPFKTDTNPQFLSGGAGSGDWSVTLDFGRWQVNEDGRFGDVDFNDKVDFARVFVTRDIGGIQLHSGQVFQDNTALGGSDKESRFTFGITIPIGGDDSGSKDRGR